jgi:hypothetical protein
LEEPTSVQASLYHATSEPPSRILRATRALCPVMKKGGGACHQASCCGCHRGRREDEAKSRLHEKERVVAALNLGEIETNMRETLLEPESQWEKRRVTDVAALTCGTTEKEKDGPGCV